MLDADPKITLNLENIRAAVADCEADLQKLARTCCMAARSARMVKLGDEVQALGQVTRLDADTAAIPADLLDAGVAQVGKVGSVLGELYATCCTATREKMYVAMFKSLFIVHQNLTRLKGGHH